MPQYPMRDVFALIYFCVSQPVDYLMIEKTRAIIRLVIFLFTETAKQQCHNERVHFTWK